MAFEGLTEKLSSAFKKLRNKGRLTESDVKEAMREIRLALLEADVSYKVVKDFIKGVTEKAVGAEVLESLTPAQAIVKIVNQELINLMGGDSTKITIASQPPTVVMMVGLQGAGKTTNAAKLAGLMRKQNGKRPLLVACDIYRPAAIQQLHVLGEQIGVPVYSEPDSKDPVQIARNAIAHAQQEGLDTVIIDTAGRLAVDEEMMNEISSIKEAIRPDETLFVVDSMTGQDAVNTAAEFDKRLDFDGVILTKLDGDSRGGAALSIRSVVNKPIKFVGTGEKMEALQVFHPSRMADRILGMGDIVSLVERAQQQYDEEEAKRLEAKIAKNQFDFDDFLAQIAQIKKMGNLKDLVSMIPGVGKMVKDLDISNDAFKGIEAIIHSMTPEERAKPSILDGSRRKRIAEGSGTSVAEVNRLIQQFDQVSKVMRKMQSGGFGRPQAKKQKKNKRRR